MRPTRLLVPCFLVVVTSGFGVACGGSEPPPAPPSPYAVGPSGGDLWQPEAKSEPTTSNPPPPVESVAPVASVSAAPTVSASASASATTKKPPAKPKSSAAPTPKASASTK